LAGDTIANASGALHAAFLVPVPPHRPRNGFTGFPASRRKPGRGFSLELDAKIDNAAQPRIETPGRRRVRDATVLGS
jgi:hypothetical protein